MLPGKLPGPRSHTSHSYIAISHRAFTRTPVMDLSKHRLELSLAAVHITYTGKYCASSPWEMSEDQYTMFSQVSSGETSDSDYI
jgi:hypothetical protein